MQNEIWWQSRKKIENFQKFSKFWNFEKLKKCKQNYFEYEFISKKLIFVSFQAFLMIFCANYESWDRVLNFFKVEISVNMSFEHEIWVNFRVKKMGSKTSKGGKNLTHENKFPWNKFIFK